MLSPITDHAMLRYLERICGLNIRDIKQKAKKLKYALTSDSHVLAFIKKQENIDVDAMRERLLTPQLKTALAMDAKSIKIDGMIMVLHGGRVMTLYRHGHVKDRLSLRPALKRGQFAGIRRDRRVWEYDTDDERV